MVTGYIEGGEGYLQGELSGVAQVSIDLGDTPFVKEVPFSVGFSHLGKDGEGVEIKIGNLSITLIKKDGSWDFDIAGLP